MASRIDTESFSVRAVDDWVMAERPSVAEAAAQVVEVRRLAREVRMAEAHLVEYVREELQLDDLSDVPAEIIPIAETDT